MRIIAFSDSEFANAEDRKSVSRGFVTIGGAPTFSMSKSQSIISLSSTETEYIELEYVTQEVMFQLQILNKFVGNKQIKPSIIF